MKLSFSFLHICSMCAWALVPAPAASAAPVVPAKRRRRAGTSTATVRVVPNFLSKAQIEQHLREEARHALVPSDFPGNRTWGAARLSPAFLRRVITEGAEQCPSAEFEAGLPTSSVGILTNRVEQTTEPHLDHIAETQRIVDGTSDVAVVFLNSNDDATFFVGEEAFAVEEGTLFMFPGGAVPHYLEMDKQHRTATEMNRGNYVHMLGPFEVGRKHRIVGYPSRRGLGVPNPNWPKGWSTTLLDQTFAQGEATLGPPSRLQSRHLQEEAPTTGSSTASDMNETDASSDLLSGTVRITGFRGGLSSDGTANSTLEVWYDIEGLDTALDFRVEMEDGPPSFCDDVRPGQVDADYPDLQGSEVADNIWHQIASTSDAEGRSQGLAYVDVGFKVDELFDHPVVLYKSDDSVLACGILKPLVMEEDSTEESSSGSTEVAADDDTASPSPSRAGLVSWAVYLLFVSSLVYAVGCI